jgi:hypothetical protein
VFIVIRTSTNDLASDFLFIKQITILKTNVMEQFKRAQVVMLPINEKATSAIMLRVVPNHCTLTKNVLNDTKDWMVFGKPHHLYFLSNKDVKKGNWYVYKNTIFKSDDDSLIGNKECKKIIATTDTSLSNCPKCNNWGQSGEKSGLCSKCGGDGYKLLPQPSQQFIEKYVECYNKGKIITDILVEYENVVQDKYGTQHIQSINDSKQYINTCKLISSNIKVNPKNNTITIKSIKDSWNREEHISNLIKYREDYEQFRKNSHFGPNKTEINNWSNKWIEQNL